MQFNIIPPYTGCLHNNRIDVLFRITLYSNYSTDTYRLSSYNCFLFFRSVLIRKLSFHANMTVHIAKIMYCVVLQRFISEYNENL